MSFDHVHFEGLDLLVSSIPSGLYLLSADFSVGFLSPEGRDLMETFHLGLSVPRSLTICIMSVCGCPFLFHLLQEDASFFFIFEELSFVLSNHCYSLLSGYL